VEILSLSWTLLASILHLAPLIFSHP
jgi:hypothetical protein